MKLAVGVIHGMGSQEPTFAEGITEELTKRFSDKGGNAADLEFEAIFWAPVLAGKETELWNRVSAVHDLDFTKLRRFVVNAFGDAIAYQPLKAKASEVQDVYHDIHRVVASALARLANAAGKDAPLVIVAHSLGAIIVSNFFWDLWNPHNAATASTPLERGETLAGLVTFGSPLALWSLRYDNYGRPIGFPHKELAKHYPRVQSQWLNFFDEDDILAYPLKELNTDYKRVVTQDLPVSVGGLVTGWNPLAHSEYWTDNSFTKPVAQLLFEVWRDCQPASARLGSRSRTARRRNLS